MATTLAPVNMAGTGISLLPVSTGWAVAGSDGALTRHATILLFPGVPLYAVFVSGGNIAQ